MNAEPDIARLARTIGDAGRIRMRARVVAVTPAGRRVFKKEFGISLLAAA